MDIKHLKPLILAEYDNVANSHDLKFISNVLFTIIKVKSDDISCKNIHQSLYVDVKLFITSYLKSVEFGDYGYDMLNHSKLDVVINTLSEVEQESILRKLILTTNESDFIDWANSRLFFLRVKRIKKSKWFNPLRYIKMLLAYANNDIRWALLFFLILIIFLNIVLLPAPVDCMGVIKFNTIDISSNKVLNHICNTLCLIVNVDDVNVMPTHLYGVLLICIWKLMSTGLFVGYVWELMLNLILKKYEELN